MLLNFILQLTEVNFHFVKNIISFRIGVPNTEEKDCIILYSEEPKKKTALKKFLFLATFFCLPIL